MFKHMRYVITLVALVIVLSAPLRTGTGKSKARQGAGNDEERE